MENLPVETIIEREKSEQEKLQYQMKKNRVKQLVNANIEEERNIKMLEKQLKLKTKGKNKNVSKYFTSDGLDYLLELYDSENMKAIVAAEQQMDGVNDDFAEDFALMTNRSITKKKPEDKIKKESSKRKLKDLEEEQSKKKAKKVEEFVDEDDDDDFGLGYESGEEEEDFDGEEEDMEDEGGSDDELGSIDGDDQGDLEDDDLNDEGDDDLEDDEGDNDLEDEGDNDLEDEGDLEDDGDFDLDGDDAKNSEDEGEAKVKSSKKVNPDGTWEDIYGRMRDKDGNVVNKTEGKYIPPAVRARMEANSTGDKKRIEKLNRLKRQFKGYLNRLAESNMHSIATQIEELYMNNSRNDVNEMLTGLILEAVVSQSITPERLLLEHILLITILQANVGTEVGAHFLQSVIKKFDELFNEDIPVEDKRLDNVVNIIAQLYNFKVFQSQLLYEILNKLSSKFEEKHVDCILSILRNVGFTLRKDNPLALKDLIINLQKQASSASEEVKDNARVKFMLDVLLAIKNNNMHKIPNYDTSYSEHLKKISKGFIRKGNYVTQLNISLEDLLKADERGKWWVVGSAWSGKVDDKVDKVEKVKGDNFSQKLLDLAKKQRMSTDTRRNIFCIIMSAEDYLDAFEKILRLGLTNQQEREIVHVLLHCCLQEKKYNPYYSVLAQKFCDYDRKYQMTIKYSVWDKLKGLTECSAKQISNLAKMLTHLFLEKGLSISTLKVVQFGDLDKITLRFMRQILIGILLFEDVEQMKEVFTNVAQSEKLKMFRESLRLFVHHFLLKNIKSDAVDDSQRSLLEERASIVEKILTVNERRRF
ncbi:PREDICTED: nucleolar MIF4G domain-containing protein 1 homolog [Nicrophorus vespilloides]|uniref:Nucleolar MIF4G domain-containing protein 1 homolog n=1 Tax=Nicrophorus vespilloides TaxID=110193 RepID=A0ABM1M8W7_NICVS|nr:PREDICTED: nucleolar MIF4G domain-containing protein 1 homolog [Nicrophorus vespilloides]